MKKKLIIISVLAVFIVSIFAFYKNKGYFNVDPTRIKAISIKVPKTGQSWEIKNITKESSIKELIKHLNAINYKTTSQEHTVTAEGSTFIVTFTEKKEYTLNFSGDIVNINGKCYNISEKDCRDVAMQITMLVLKEK